MSEMSFKFFNRNPRGRDFVVGDIHGQFSTLETLLKQVKFQAAQDRVFSVGDMIDRGPESWRVVEFLNYPWFHAILGNHEQMLLDAAENPSIGKNWMNYNGGEWWQAVPPHLHERIRRIIGKLPLAMEVQTRSGRIGIVHADIPNGMDWKTFVSHLGHDEEVREQALWSRTRFKQLQMVGRTQPIAGIDMVVFGHTPTSRPLQQSNICYIDTGATYTNDRSLGRLTLLEIQPQLKIHQLRTQQAESKNRQQTQTFRAEPEQITA